VKRAAAVLAIWVGASVGIPAVGPMSFPLVSALPVAAEDVVEDVEDEAEDADDGDNTGLWGLAGLLGLLGLLGLRKRRDDAVTSRPVGADTTPRGSSTPSR
jgi:MYXO-CTERM domain-containing protein